jgi:DNA-binding LacI/PurR family transcriptional regulator
MGTWAAETILELIRGSGRRPRQNRIDVGFSIKVRGSTAALPAAPAHRRARAAAETT